MKHTTHALCGCLLITAVPALAPHGARAQPCSNAVFEGVPDFDRARANTGCPPGTIGLPNNGVGWGYPTTLANWIAYMANHGFPELSTPQGPQNWHSPGLYNDVSLMITELGDYMGTGSAGTPPGWEAGFAQYVADHAPFETFSISTYVIAAAGEQNLFRMAADIMRSGGFVQLAFSPWIYHPGQPPTYCPVPGVFFVSLVAVRGACTTSPDLTLHDPLTGGVESPCTQTPPADHESGATYLTAWFDPDCNAETAINLSQWRLDGFSGAATAFVRSIRTFVPSYLVGGCAASGCLVFVRPRWWDGSLPGTEITPLPYQAPVQHVVFSPEMATVFVTTAPVGGQRPIPARLLRYSIADRSFETLAEYTQDPDLVTFDRFGELYLRDGGTLRRYDVRGAAPSPRAGRGSPDPIDAVIYDDVSDELIGVSAQTDELISWPRGLESETRRALPVALGGAASIGISPVTNRAWVAGSDSNIAHELVVGPGGHLIRGRQAVLPGLRAGVDSLTLDGQERLFVVSDSQLHVFRQTRAGGTWEPLTGSPFHGVEVGRAFAIPRSRDNFTGPARQYLDLEGDQTLPPPCPVDYSGDGAANSQDFFDFLTAFFAGSPAADFNNDDVVNSQDFFDFLAAFFAGC